VRNVLQEEQLGERLAAIDTIQFTRLKALRDRIVEVIDAYLETRHELRTAPAGEEFHFMDAVSFVIPTGHEAHSLAEFADALRRVGSATIAFHLFEARLRVEADDNDFSRWLEIELHEPELAAAIRRLDPYTHTMEGLRQRLLRRSSSVRRRSTRSSCSATISAAAACSTSTRPRSAGASPRS
jgi:uncharacterized protein DUF5752